MATYQSFVVGVLSIVLSLLVTFVIHVKRRYVYWKSRGISQLEPEFFYGDVKDMFTGKIAFSDQVLKLYRAFKAKGVIHGGFYSMMQPVYLPLDLEIIKCILVKDFDSFMNRGMYINEKSEPLSGHLFNLEDARWRNLRQKLSPTFTSGKMKMMFEIFQECTIVLKEKLNEYALSEDAIDIKEILARFTTDVIGNCAFGIECNSLKDPTVEFREYGSRIFRKTSRLKLFISRTLPKQFLRLINFRLRDKDVEDFFVNVVKNTIEYRENNNITRKDFLQMLIELKNFGQVNEGEHVTSAKGNNSPVLNLNELAAQCFVFFIAGFETSSTTMAFAFYELAENQDVQEKLRTEINSVLSKHDNTLSYEAIGNLKYLDQVIQEVLRKYPPGPAVPRICNKRYKIPGSDLVLEKGTRIQIPILGIHMDSDYYEDPEKFDPDRFTEENKAKRPAFSWMPFGEGPRICIGSRFGLLQSKVGIATILKEYKVTLNSKTKTPLVMDPSSFISAARGGIWINLTKID